MTEKEIANLLAENEKLKRENRELQKRVSDAGWQYEYDHVDDWRKVTEMGQL